MDTHTALAFKMASEHLRPLLPEVTRGYLEPHFARAQAVLDEHEGNALSDWPAKVRVVAPGQQLLPPAIAQDVLEAVQTGLLRERRLLVTYRKRGESETRMYEVHPQALVWRDAVGYLLCTLWDYDDVVQLVLHRMDRVEVQDLEEDDPGEAAVAEPVRRVLQIGQAQLAEDEVEAAEAGEELFQADGADSAFYLAQF